MLGLVRITCDTPPSLVDHINKTAEIGAIKLLKNLVGKNRGEGSQSI